jgi:hypothetical protein
VNVLANDLATWNDVTGKVRVYINKDSHVLYSSSPTAGWNTNGQSKFTITSPQPGWYYFLPVGTSYGSSQGYQFQVTAQYFGAEPPDAGFDAGPKPDGGPHPDAGPNPDAGPKPDGGPYPDGGPKPDGGPHPDVGPNPDAGPKTDAGPQPDAGPVQDAGPSDKDTGTATGVDSGGAECACDLTYACDENCDCDQDCATAESAASGGCSCSVIGL